LVSLFGVAAVRAPRFGPCRCGIACRRSLTPVAEIMPDRCTPEYERVVAAMGAALPYRRALALLGEFFPLAAPPRSRPHCQSLDRTTSMMAQGIRAFPVLDGADTDKTE
jgi:hypothetical protein